MFTNYAAVERLIHSLKTAIACSAAYLLARLIGQPADQWIIISVIVVMCGQIYVGSEIDEEIIKSLLKQRQLASDAAPELIGKRFDPDHFAHTLFCEREILRAINFMDMALSKITSLPAVYSTQNPLIPFNKSVIETLDVLIRVLRTNQLTHAHVHLPDLKQLTTVLQQNPELSGAGQRVYLDGFVFSAEILVNHLRELAVLYEVPM